LLGAARLYRVPALATEWEPRARANLARELRALEPVSGGPPRA
jgi:predicted metal-dependent HD superfamily phosphohydrolase